MRVDSLSPQHELILDPLNCDSFESARDVFKVGLGHYEAAKKVFVLDGFVSDHVAIVQEVSQLYKHLATWEEDPKRAIAMQNRRVKMLGALLGALNVKVYNAQHKQLNFELGEAHATLSEVLVAKCEQGTEKEQPVWATPAQRAADVTKYNASIATSIKHFEAFVALFRSPLLAPHSLNAHTTCVRPCTYPQNMRTPTHSLSLSLSHTHTHTLSLSLAFLFFEETKRGICPKWKLTN